jgi:hypothetical protein
LNAEEWKRYEQLLGLMDVTKMADPAVIRAGLLGLQPCFTVNSNVIREVNILKNEKRSGEKCFQTAVRMFSTF